ncbi:MAG: hypothetical protein HOC20_01720 [Chloroflexi bacterium]|nr:hypothetical protein [Chloroflexota bacterium]
MFEVLLQTIDQFFDGLGLIAVGQEIGGEFEFRHACRPRSATLEGRMISEALASHYVKLIFSNLKDPE